MHPLFRRKGVHAVGRGRKRVKGKLTDVEAIIVSVDQKLPAQALSADEMVPKTFDGTITDVVQKGPFRALASGYEGKIRPVPIGYSIGHFAVTAGTLGAYTKRGSNVYILSNNHVMANSNAAAEGDPILQPGPYDGGTAQDAIASLAAFIPIQFIGNELSGCKLSRAVVAVFNAIARLFARKTRLKAVIQDIIPVNYVDAALALAAAGIPDFSGNPVVLAEAGLGDAVYKTGRTTGEIEQVDVAVQIQYGAGQIAYFEDQLMAGAMSAGGDSGSAVLNQRGELVGLLFAGSDDTTIINRIQRVEAAFGGFDAWTLEV